MTVTVTNPETIRDEVAAFLETDLVGSGKPAQAVYNYEKKDFSGQSPVVLVATGGDNFNRHSNSERVKGSIYLDVLIFVLYSDDASGWTEADCEDALNLVKKTTLDSIFNNQFTPSRSIFIEGRSNIIPANVGGQSYRLERVALRVELFNG
ncbi:MAG: hypothetical protein BroJett011_62790 [Chloroflexota bacterium]|nr:MAG: hypothetical protein BroJett011_62790 [Chloroflexota bacterium]